MSIQAVAWALEQDFSYTTPKGHVRCCHAAKLVLISLANHADHTSGHCWPSAETIAREASCAIKTVYRLVAALERNGFIDVKRTRDKHNKQRSNNYWILFDRNPAEWKFFAGDESEDDNEPGNPEPGNTESPGESDANYHSSESETDSGLPGPGNDEITRDLRLEPSVVEPSAPEPTTTAVAAPKRFDATARASEQARQKAADEARAGELFPVIEGSAPWEAWMRHPDPRTGKIHSPTLTCKIKLENGRIDQGWYFPTLWPKKHEATGPPLPPEAKKAG